MCSILNFHFSLSSVIDSEQLKYSRSFLKVLVNILVPHSLEFLQTVFALIDFTINNTYLAALPEEVKQIITDAFTLMAARTYQMHQTNQSGYCTKKVFDT